MKSKHNSGKLIKTIKIRYTRGGNYHFFLKEKSIWIFYNLQKSKNAIVPWVHLATNPPTKDLRLRRQGGYVLKKIHPKKF